MLNVAFGYVRAYRDSVPKKAFRSRDGFPTHQDVGSAYAQQKSIAIAKLQPNDSATLINRVWSFLSRRSDFLLPR